MGLLRFCRISVCCWLLMMMTAVVLAAEGPELFVMGPDHSLVRLDASVLKAKASELYSQDRNFPSPEPVLFEGVFIVDLIGEAEGSVTLLSEDQYVASFPMGVLADSMAMLAWNENGRPIPRHRGGPLKIVFGNAANLHPSANAWYVKVLLSDRGQDLPLRMIRGPETHIFLGGQMPDNQRIAKQLLPPVPKGYRYDTERPRRQFLRGFILGDFLKDRYGAFTGVTLRSLSGQELRLVSSDIEGKDLFFFGLNEEGPLGVSRGGPWMLWVPVLKYPQLAVRLPNPDTLFFIYEMIVE
ncbi:molybdopterin-dependent oxidoreductase [Desulfobotulus sp. H1]|uniref:Molybdopterin-dependent oxidoreductase n=1 Tax=Desulfobotulus pelophilus TaxID=2823377 RepID=A0ABT3NB90_9BACT|nr:molybdopterin-dependent oxidoreductase [Desulfobotulus pelophilus]MCW7754731.1 molybdopterin-dependent oxidoreductase [Desulfobotulus pelophilus]